MFGNQQSAAVEMLCHAAQHTGIPGSHAVVQIRIRHFRFHHKKQWQIDGTQCPEEIREYDIRILDLITFHGNMQKIRPHEQIVNGKFLFLKQIKQDIPVRHTV